MSVFSWILCSYAALVVTAILFLIRNQCVYLARIAAIDCGDWPKTYRRLPTYEEMLYRPKYWTLWTRAHWMAWAARQTEAAAVSAG